MKYFSRSARVLPYSLPPNTASAKHSRARFISKRRLRHRASSRVRSKSSSARVAAPQNTRSSLACHVRVLPTSLPMLPSWSASESVNHRSFDTAILFNDAVYDFLYFSSDRFICNISRLVPQKRFQVNHGIKLNKLVSRFIHV